MKAKFAAGIIVVGISLSLAHALANNGPQPTVISEGRRPAVSGGADGTLNLTYETAAKPGAKVNDIFYLQTSDGKQWKGAKNLSASPGNSSTSDLAVEKSGAIDVIWSDATTGGATPDIFFSRSTDNGQTWSPPKDIATTPGASTQPAIAIGPEDSIHVVWRDTSAGDKMGDIFYTCSVDGGKTFAENPLLPATNISKTPGNSVDPTIAVAPDGTVHVAWSDSSSGKADPDIYYTKKSKDGGKMPWAKPVDLSNTFGTSSHPDLACGSEGQVYLAWSDQSVDEKNPDILLVQTNESGDFGKPVNISNSMAASINPSVTANGVGRVAVAWSDAVSGAEKPDIFAVFSVNSGKRFSKPVDMSNTIGTSDFPDVTFVGNNMYVVWQETNAGKSDLEIASKLLE